MTSFDTIQRSEKLAGHRRCVPLGAAMLALLSGCGGSGSPMATSAAPPATSATAACTSANCGSAVMTMTDAAGDFLTYQVTLVSLQLQKSDGTLVETIPASTSLDLVQLVDLTEILSSRLVPPGDYVAAQLSIDYTNATIMVDDGTGSGVAVKPVDSAGVALGLLTLTVKLDAKNHLKIDAVKVSRIAFDFNLLASNLVDLATKTVTVAPTIVASVIANDDKPTRVRGELVQVDAAGSDYTLQVDPFHEHHHDKLSPLIVHTTDATSFEINGAPYAGAAGLAQLAGTAAGTLTVAFGTLAADQTFTATSVLAGTSVEGAAIDHIVGSVIARSANSLTVHGAEFDDREDDHDFMAGDTVISIAAATAVTVQGQTSATPSHNIEEISVGSLIDAFGTSSKDPSGNVSFDASAGRVRLAPTHIQGVVSASDPAQLTLSLNAIDRQPISLFSFTGTGSSLPSNPIRYVVSTGALDLSPFSVGGPVLAIGFVAPFGSAPPDFQAVSLAAGGGAGDDDDDVWQLDVDWGNNGTASPFKSLDATQLDLDRANAEIGGHHRIKRDETQIDVKKLAGDPLIKGAASGTTLFAITGQHGRATYNFESFTDFEAALATDLDETTTALRLTARGDYDPVGVVFIARRITVLLSN